ncbi:unnamed protein product [Gordionus sp. m RMFG-2023]|uniref:uncharacterized protein LOC135928349 n=1 Tax=Gordionus sp. m RMFG-2023 TaxID=3053472 RepID=UPI0030E051AA
MIELKTVSGFFITNFEIVGYCYISLVLTVLGMVGNILMYLSFNNSRKKSGGKKQNIESSQITTLTHSIYNIKKTVIEDIEKGEIKKDFCKKDKEGMKIEERFLSPRRNQKSNANKLESCKKMHSINLNISHVVSKIHSIARKIVSRNKGLATVTTFYAECLSVNNFIFCLTLTPWPLLYYWGTYNQSLFWRSKYYNLFMSNIEFPLRNICSKISTGITLAMTVDRFIALKMPLRYKSLSTLKNSKIGMIIITLASVMIESRTTNWFRTVYVHFIVMKNYLYYNPLSDKYIERWLSLNNSNISNIQPNLIQSNSSILLKSSIQYINVYSGYFLEPVTQTKLLHILEIICEILAVGVPMLIIAVLSYFIIVALRSYFKNRKKMKELFHNNKNININNSNVRDDNTSKINGNRTNLKLSAEESKATMTQITIVIQFFICEIPQAITSTFYYNFMCESLNDLNCNFRNYLVLTNILMLANHCLTFYIFMIFNDNFRKLVKNIFLPS